MKSVLEQIFRLCVPEFEGMEVEEIKKYILDIQVLSKEVSAKKILEKGYSLEVIEVVLGIIKAELRDYMEQEN